MLGGVSTCDLTDTGIEVALSRISRVPTHTHSCAWEEVTLAAILSYVQLLGVHDFWENVSNTKVTIVSISSDTAHEARKYVVWVSVCWGKG